MSYIGRGIDQIDNISTLDNLSFNGSDATFNLTQNSVAFVPVSADALQIQIDGVIQSGNYTVSGSTVTFDFTPSGSSVCNGIKHFGVGLLTTVSDGAITNVKLGADSVNGSKIADDSISDEHLDNTAITGQTAITSLADTDKFLVSQASDSGNLKYVEKQYLPSGGLQFITSSASSSAHGTITLDNIFSSSYRNYIVIGDFTPATNNADIELRFRNSGGTQSDTEYQQHLTRYNADSDSRNTKRYNGVNSFRFSTVGLNNDTARVGLSFHMVFWNPNDSNVRGKFYVTGVGVDNAAMGFQFNGMGQYKGTSAHTGLIFFPASGNFSVSNVKVYGVVDS